MKIKTKSLPLMFCVLVIWSPLLHNLHQTFDTNEHWCFRTTNLAVVVLVYVRLKDLLYVAF